MSDQQSANSGQPEGGIINPPDVLRIAKAAVGKLLRPGPRTVASRTCSKCRVLAGRHGHAGRRAACQDAAEWGRD